MVLVNRLQTEFFVECHEVLEHRPQFVHLVENGLLEVVLVVAHSVTLDAELGGDLELLDVQLVIGVVDARGHDGHFQSALFQRRHHLRQLIGHLLGGDLAARPDGALDTVKAQLGNEIGQIIVGQHLQRLGKHAVRIAPLFAASFSGQQRRGQSGGGEELPTIHTHSVPLRAGRGND